MYFITRLSQSSKSTAICKARERQIRSPSKQIPFLNFPVTCDTRVTRLLYLKLCHSGYPGLAIQGFMFVCQIKKLHYNNIFTKLFPFISEQSELMLKCLFLVDCCSRGFFIIIISRKKSKSDARTQTHCALSKISSILYLLTGDSNLER